MVQQRRKPDNREMYELYLQEVDRKRDVSEEKPDLFPAIKGLKSVTHDQFQRMRDGYVTQSYNTKRSIQSQEKEHFE